VKTKVTRVAVSIVLPTDDRALVLAAAAAAAPRAAAASGGLRGRRGGASRHHPSAPASSYARQGLWGRAAFVFLTGFIETGDAGLFLRALGALVSRGVREGARALLRRALPAGA
jgi:hypothetical protein